MSKTVTIPTCRDPFRITINHVTYEYPAGATVEVPDEVAAQIEYHRSLVAKPKKTGGFFLQDECIKTWEELVEEGHIVVEGTRLISSNTSGSKSDLNEEVYYANQSCSLMIPEGIERIEECGCSSFSQITCAIYLPSSIKYIGVEAFYAGGTEITHVFLYAGTMKQFREIDIASDANIRTVCCKDGLICGDWHYVW